EPPRTGQPTASANLGSTEDCGNLCGLLSIDFYGSGNTGIPRTTVGPVTLSVYFLGHCLRQGHGLVEGSQDVGRGQFLFVVKGIIQCADDCFFNFGAAEIRAGSN